MKNDKSDTIKFEPVKREMQKRSENDRYSEKRSLPPETEEYDDNTGSSDKNLKLAVVGLTAIIIVVILAGIFIIGGFERRSKTEDIPEEITDEIIIEEEENEEITDDPEEFDIVFYGESIKNRDGRVEIKADLYDGDFNKVDTKKIIINSSTKIRENGKRITPEGLCYIVESFTGDMIIFKGLIRDDGYAESLSFDGSFKEEIQEETEEKQDPEKEEEPVEKEETDKTDNSDGTVTEEIGTDTEEITE